MVWILQVLYLALVPVLGLLHILLAYLIVLDADFVESLSQVRVWRINLHLHLRILDLLTQVIHLLQEPLL